VEFERCIATPDTMPIIRYPAAMCAVHITVFLLLFIRVASTDSPMFAVKLLVCWGRVALCQIPRPGVLLRMKLLRDVAFHMRRTALSPMT
jgi:hypothetical protein